MPPEMPEKRSFGVDAYRRFGGVLIGKKESDIFSKEVLAVMPRCIEWRRRLHQYPELSFEEYKTTAFLIEELRKIPGLELQMPTKTGVVAILRGAYPGRRIALRADIDALPIQEETGLPFASQVPGIMHACGHDGHTAMQMAAAALLAEEREQLHGEVRFIFQHAEELPPGGAVEMAACGVMEGVEEIYGMHLSSAFPTGSFGIRAGALTSATDRFDIKILGKGGHSAFPETCTDPIVAAAQLITALQTVVSRNIKATEPAVVSVCMVNAGSAYNIIPGEISLTGSTRTFNKETRQELPKLLERLTKGVCESFGASYEFRFTLGYASVINDKKLTQVCRQVVDDAFGKEALFELEPLMPGEDFSAFLEHCPGFFMELGARSEAKGCTVPHHNGHYLLDEDALPYGVEYLCRLVRDRLS